jgi:uncharacterized RDD family membrane protein YckC
MTQQGDWTSQDSGAVQAGQDAVMPRSGQGEASSDAAPTWPSPFLAEGQAVPEAYPAPPQPGMPRYGMPAAPTQNGRQIWPGPANQQGGGQPGYEQPGYGRGRSGQPGGGQAAGASAGSRPDVVLAGAWERLLAMTLDWALILGASFLILHGPMLLFWHRLQTVLLSAQTEPPTAAQNAYRTFAQSPTTTSTLIHFSLLTFGIALPYFWALYAVGGATLGKRAVGLRVVKAADKSRPDVGTAGIRAGVFLIGPAIFALAPNVGFVSGGAIITLGAILWLADCLLLVTDFQRRSLHDRAADTLVVRKAALERQQSRASSPW